MAFGSPEQQAYYLPRIVDGSDWWCQGYSEPGAGSDLASLKMSAVRDGDHYVLNGQKTWTTLGQFADKIFCLVRTSSEGKRQEGISFILVDMNTPGVEVRPIILLEGTHEVNEVWFTDVRVPVDNLVGEENKGWTYAKYLLVHERSGIAGVGAAIAGLEHLKMIAADQKKDGKPLIEDPFFAAQLCEIEVDLSAMRTSNLRVTQAANDGAPPGPETSMLKIKGTEIRQSINDLTRRALGPYAMPFVSEALDAGYNEEPIGPDYANPISVDYFMTSTMNALVLKGDGYESKKPDSIALADLNPFVEFSALEIPNPEKGQVRIKVALASINPSDEMFIQGLYGQPRIKGKAAGFEGVGEVVASGGGAIADGLMGLRVAFVASPNGQGTWSEFSIADAATCIPLIDGVRNEDGAAMIVNPLTALAMFDIVKDEGEKSFVVSAGASQLCKLMIAAAKDEGFKPIALVRRDDQIAPLKAMGAEHVLNTESADFDNAFAAICKAEKPRIFLDAVANSISAKVFNSMGRGARWVIYGKLDEELPTILEPGQLIFMSKKIEGFWLTKWMMEKPLDEKMKAIQMAQKNFASGAWQTDVTAIVPLGEAIERLPLELAKPNGKVFLNPQQ